MKINDQETGQRRWHRSFRTAGVPLAATMVQRSQHKKTWQGTLVERCSPKNDLILLENLSINNFLTKLSEGVCEGE